jgi:hypothetical protein
VYISLNNPDGIFYPFSLNILFYEQISILKFGEKWINEIYWSTF